MRIFHIDDRNTNAAALIKYLESLDFVSEKPEPKDDWLVDDISENEKQLLLERLAEVKSGKAIHYSIEETKRLLELDEKEAEESRNS